MDVSPLRLAILSDFREERWPSMDLCADMLVEQATSDGPRHLAVTRVCPPFRRRLAALPRLGRSSWAHNGDRFLNRHVYFPRHLRRRRDDFDLFHVCDHSYAQLALELPGPRTGILCHDVDAFRCLVEPAREPRPRWFRWMMRRVLRGLRQAAIVFHTTNMVKDDILRFGLVAPEKLVHAPLGYAPEFSAERVTDSAAGRIVAELEGRPFLLHVGSCIPRKRVDFLLQLFASVRARFPEIRLIKVGGTWSAAHQDMIRRLGVESGLVHLHGIGRPTLAALYQRAAVVLLPSEAEGFGLPVLEALACGSPVLATDLPALREVGGSAALYGPFLDLDFWRDQVIRVLTNSAVIPPRDARLAQARKYSWNQHARIILQTYQGLAA